jgi:hypothetical protein
MDLYQKDGVIRATTGQLAWDVSRPGRGFFTIHAPGTRAIVGFQPDQPQKLGGATLAFSDAPFAGVFLSSLDRKQPVEQADRLLLTVMARAGNTGMTFNETRDELLTVGDGPVLIEPVSVNLSLTGRSIQAVHVLDHDGRRTGTTLPLPSGATGVRCVGAETRAIYYELILTPAATP